MTSSNTGDPLDLDLSHPHPCSSRSVQEDALPDLQTGSTGPTTPLDGTSLLNHNDKTSFCLICNVKTQILGGMEEDELRKRGEMVRSMCLDLKLPLVEIPIPMIPEGYYTPELFPFCPSCDTKIKRMWDNKKVIEEAGKSTAALLDDVEMMVIRAEFVFEPNRCSKLREMIVERYSNKCLMRGGTTTPPPLEVPGQPLEALPAAGTAPIANDSAPLPLLAVVKTEIDLPSGNGSPDAPSLYVPKRRRPRRRPCKSRTRRPVRYCFLDNCEHRARGKPCPHIRKWYEDRTCHVCSRTFARNCEVANHLRKHMRKDGLLLDKFQPPPPKIAPPRARTSRRAGSPPSTMALPPAGPSSTPAIIMASPPPPPPSPGAGSVTSSNMYGFTKKIGASLRVIRNGVRMTARDLKRMNNN